MANRKITQLPVLSSATDEDIIPIVDDSELTTKQIQVGDLLADQITEAERTKLTGIAEGATANQTDAQLRDRSTHTGTQALSTISDAGTSASLDVPATGNASASEVVKGNDSRLTDARHPILP